MQELRQRLPIERWLKAIQNTLSYQPHYAREVLSLWNNSEFLETGQRMPCKG